MGIDGKYVTVQWHDVTQYAVIDDGESSTWNKVVINGTVYSPELTCKGCAVPDKDYGHAPSPCLFCCRNKSLDMYEPKEGGEDGQEV